MSSPRFFSPAALSVGITVELAADAARHAVRVLRLGVGDAVTLFDGRGGEYECRIESCGRSRNDRTVVDVLSKRNVERESPLDLVLVQALQTGEKMDLTVQKAVELGATRIVPVMTRRSVVRLEGERAAKRVAHWRAVAASACEQCGRNRVPEIEALTDLGEWLGRPASGGALRLMLDPVGAMGFDSLPRPASGQGIDLLIGAEGGLSEDERRCAVAAGFSAVRLGPRILRTETAGLATLAVIQCLWGDFRDTNRGA